MEVAKILEALAKLDPANDNHWTTEGTPRIDTVKFLLAGSNVSRDDITKAAPNFTRENPVLPTADTAAPAADSAAQATAGTVTITSTDSAAPAADTPAATVDTGAGTSEGDQNGQVQSEATTGEATVGDTTVEEVTVSATLEEQFDAARDKVAKMQNWKEEFDKAFAEATAEHDRLAEAIAEKNQNSNSTSAIQDYLAGQLREREQRAARLNSLRDLNLTAKAIADLVPQASPLDKALGSRQRQS